VAREPPADLAQAVTWSVVLRHLEKRGVDHPLRSGEGGGQLSPKQRSSLERLVAELTQLIAGDVAPTPGSGGIHGIPPWVQAAASLALKNAESADTPFGQAFRRVVAGGPDDGDWKTLALDEFCSTIAGLYLERVYKTALQDELGWQAEASTRPDATERARRVVELLQRIAKGSSRGRKAESQEEVMRRVQEAVDRIKERGDKLNRYSIAAELWITPSGLDALMRRHDLRRTKDGRILCN